MKRSPALAFLALVFLAPLVLAAPATVFKATAAEVQVTKMTWAKEAGVDVLRVRLRLRSGAHPGAVYLLAWKPCAAPPGGNPWCAVGATAWMAAPGSKPKPATIRMYPGENGTGDGWRLTTLVADGLGFTPQTRPGLAIP